jgi:8-oxo-dGTP diphosphatase
MQVNKFNIRVYGILINSKQQVLVCDELIAGREITKFPGGGLEFGEGTIECLKREFMEETNNEVAIISHYYTTDYFQPSLYDTSHQIISIYYLVKPVSNFDVQIKTKPFDFDFSQKEKIAFRWINLEELTEAHFTMPIDKLVGARLSKK